MSVEDYKIFAAGWRLFRNGPANIVAVMAGMFFSVCVDSFAFVRGDKLKCVFCGAAVSAGLSVCPKCLQSGGADKAIVGAEENLQDIAAIIGLTEDTDKNLKNAIGGIIGIAERLERGC